MSFCGFSFSLAGRGFGAACASFFLAAAGVTAAGIFATPPASAQGTRLWTQSRADEFEKGTPQGVAITSDGKLRVGPAATEIITTPATFAWGVAEDKAGVAYVATGSPARVLRVDADGKQTTLFETKALAVQALRLGPDGALYAATMPDGRVYRFKGEALNANGAKPLDETSAEVVFDLGAMEAGKTAAGSDAPTAEADKSKTEGQKADGTNGSKPEAKARYIWDLTFDSGGRLYIATGGPAAIYRIDVKQAGAKAELYFATDEQHVRTLAWEAAGKDGVQNLLAGTDGSGLIYRITAEKNSAVGKGYVLFSAPRREITALAVGADGAIYAADVGDKSHNPLPALPVQNGSGITITFVQPGSVQAANASTTLPEGSEIYVLRPNVAPRKLWADKDAIVYQLASYGDGVVALTGNRGRILEIHPDGTFSDIAHLDAQQAVAMTRAADGANGQMLVTTANTGKLYRLGGAVAASKDGDQHSYASDVLDAGALSRWGRVEMEPGSHGFRLWTRSGNVEQPARSAKDWGWSDWQPVVDGKVASPAGRYLQWKATLNADGVVGGVGVNYLPVNSAPVVDDVVVVPGARVTPQAVLPGQPGTVNIAFPTPTQGAGLSFDANASANGPIQAQKDRTAVTARWAAHDDDGDELTFNLYLRGDGEQVWRLLRKDLTERVYSFDAGAIPDGGYQLKVMASDASSHTPGDALTGELVSDRFELDTTPPVISDVKAGAPEAGNCKPAPCRSIPVRFAARDAISPIVRAEYSLDAGPWQYLDPVGGLSDSKDEEYAIAVPVLPATDANGGRLGPDAGTVESLDGEHLIVVRVYDRHENMGAAKVVVPAAKQAR